MQAKQALDDLKASPKLDVNFKLFASISAPCSIRSLSQTLHKLAATDTPALITGESGTGKEMSARTIHALSFRRHYPLLSLNCATLPNGLTSCDLLGFEKRILTASIIRQTSRIEPADGGTLFLDNIGEMPLLLQDALIRFLHERFTSRGKSTERHRTLDVRVIAASNVDLGKATREGRFREELFCILSRLWLHIPPLRERGNDLQELTQQFTLSSSKELGSQVVRASPQAVNILLRHVWPGNISELKSTIFRSLLLCNGSVLLAKEVIFETLSETLPKLHGMKFEQSGILTDRPFVSASPISREQMIAALLRQHGNVSHTAQALGVSRVTLYRLTKRFGLDLDQARNVLDPSKLAVS